MLFPGPDRAQNWMETHDAVSNMSMLRGIAEHGRIHYQNLNAALLEQACQPKAVVVCLVAQDHLRNLPRDLGHAFPCRIELGHQAVGVAALDRM